MSSSNWKINDAVYIEQKQSSTSSSPAPSSSLQGVIAYLGPVKFAEGTDWVGIRLTGPSVGKGKNDGTVQGIQYFQTGGVPNGGLFVKKSVLKRRALSRLEELRLKRELKGGSVGSSPSVRRLNLSGSGDRGDADDDSSVSSMSSMRSSATSATNRSRLEEIRSRRLALQRNNSKMSRSSPAITSPPASSSSNSNLNSPGVTKIKATPTQPPSSSTSKSNRKTPTTSTPVIHPTTPISNNTPRQPQEQRSQTKTPATTPSPTKAEIENSHLKTKIEILVEKLETSEGRSTSLQSELDASVKEVHELKLQLNESIVSMEQVKRDAELKIAEAELKAKANENDEDQGDNDESDNNHALEVQNLNKEIESLRNKNTELQKQNVDEINRLKLKFEVQITSIQESFDAELSQKDAENTSLQTQLSSQEGKLSFLEKRIVERDEQAALREDHDSTHYKERAKLQADILSWQRKVQEVTKDKLEMELTLEELTLDKESLQERCEEVEDLLDELKIDAESAQMEAEEMRIELESARERAERAEAALALGNASGGGKVPSGAGGVGSGNGTMVDAEDIAQALSIQNARLREAIIRLREQTNFEKMELLKKLRAAERESGAVAGLKEEVTKLLSSEKTLKSEVNELKEMVDQGSAFEQMVEEMSDRVLAVEDNNIALQSTIRSLEEAEELNAEMEEAQADEIKALMKELQNRDTVVINLEEAIKM